MNLIDGLLQELIDLSQDWNKDELSISERNLKIDVLINQVDRIGIDYTQQSLENLTINIQNVFNQLLFAAKFNATDSLTLLKKIDNKRQYNNKARLLISKKLYFYSLHRTIARSISAYTDKARTLPVKEFQVFITTKSEDDEQ